MGSGSTSSRAQCSVHLERMIRAGLPVTVRDTDVGAEPWEPPEPKGIQLGDTVRAIRAPHFGKIGRVKSLPVDLVTMESETRVRIMEVEFDDGTVAGLPRANVESIDR